MSEKIYAYKIEVDEKGIGSLWILRSPEDVFERFTEVGDVSGKSADQVSEIAKSFLKAYDLEVSQEVVESVGYTKEQKSDIKDLQYVRKQMKTILEKLADPNVPVDRKKEMLAIYQTMCASASIITSACKLELAFQNSAKTLKVLK